MNRRLAADHLVLGLVLSLLLASCGGPAEGDAEASALQVVITTTILADVAAEIVGEAGHIETLMERGQDPHGVALSARQAASIRDADVVIANGLGLEESLLDALASAEQEGVEVLRVAERLDPIERGGAPDPHVWLDPVRMADGARLMAAALASAEGPGGLTDGQWRQRGEDRATEILAGHADVEQILAAVPQRCRRLVTNHDSLAYLADRYDFEVVGTVVPGTSSQAEPSARDFADTARTIGDAGVAAIFVESVEPTRLAEALAAEVGREVAVVTLFTASLGPPGSGADTYLGMLRTDAERIAEALRDCPAA